MKEKKIIALVLSIGMMLTLFAACAPKTTEPAVTTPVSTTTSSPKLAEPVTLKIISRNNGFAKDNNNTIFKKMEELSGYKFDWELRSSEGYPQACQVLIASNDYPDMLEFWNVSYPIELEQMAQDKIIIPMNDIVAEYGPNILKQRPDYTWYVSPSDGKRYGIAARTSDNVTNDIPIVRKDWMDKLGIAKVPETVDELKSMLIAFRDNAKTLVGAGKTVIPYSTYNMSPKRFEQGLFQTISSSQGYGRDWNIVGDGVVYHINMPGYKETMRTLREFYQEGLIDAEYTLMNRQQQLDKCYSGICGVADWTIDQMDETAQFYQAYKSANPELEIVPLYPMKDKDGNRVTSGSSSHQTKTIIFSSSKKQIDCIKFLDWVCTDEGSHLLEMGIEGVNWNMGSDGFPVLKKMSSEEKTALGFFSYNWLARTFGSIPYYASKVVRETSAVARTYAVIPPVDGSTETSITSGPALNEFMRNGEADLIISKDINFDTAFNKFVKKWNDDGGAKWQQEMSEQYRKEQALKNK